MAYTLKSSGIATSLIVCVAVDDDGTIKDFKGNAITLGTGVAASVADGTWKGVSRKYFETTSFNTYDVRGVSFNATQPSVDETDSDGMSVWFCCNGASGTTYIDAPFIQIAGSNTERKGLGRVSESDNHVRFSPGGGTQAKTTTAVPTDGTTKFSVGANYRSNVSSQIFYGLESGSLASEATAGADGGFGGVHQIFGLGGAVGGGQGAQPFKPFIACVFNRQLTLAEMQSLHDDWFGTLFDVSGQQQALAGAATATAQAAAALTIAKNLIVAAQTAASAIANLSVSSNTVFRTTLVDYETGAPVANWTGLTWIWWPTLADMLAGTNGQGGTGESTDVNGQFEAAASGGLTPGVDQGFYLITDFGVVAEESARWVAGRFDIVVP